MMPSILQARRLRKAFGGGMRQSGILAAAALYALDHHVELLKDDHRRAKHLAVGLSQIPGFECHTESIQTNIVYAYIRPHLVLGGEFKPESAITARLCQLISQEMKKHGILMSSGMSIHL